MVNNGQRDKTRLGTVQDFKKNLKIQCISHCVGIILYSSIMQMNAVVWYWHSIIISNISLWAISVISKTNQLWFLTMGYSRKIQKGGGAMEWRHGISRGIEKIECGNSKCQ